MTASLGSGSFIRRRAQTELTFALLNLGCTNKSVGPATHRCHGEVARQPVTRSPQFEFAFPLLLGKPDSNAKNSGSHAQSVQANVALPAWNAFWTGSMEKEQVAHVCSLIETAIAEFEENNGASCSSGPALSGGPISVSVVSELYDIFADEQSSGGNNLDSEFWNELAERRVRLSALAGALKATMDKGGRHGLKAARVYLGLFLVDECPLYSLFNPLSFQVLVQCIRSCCFPTELGQQEKRKRKGSKGKRIRVTDSQEDGMEGEGGLEQPGQGGERQQGRKESASLQEVVLLMGALQKTLQVLPLKEHPDTLKAVVELVVDLPLLMADLAEEDDETGPSRGAPKARRLTPKSGPTSILIMSFSILRGLLQACHGELMEIAAIIIRALAPSILCTQAAGSQHQKAQLRGAALEFVTNELLASNRNTFLPAVLALARYLCVKAPEKVEARTLAVEAVVTVVKGLGPSDWSGFGMHVAKLSRSKPRHRLFAIDVGLALFGKLPDPFERDAESSSPRMCRVEHTNAQDHSDSGEEAETCDPREGNAAAPSTASPPWGVPCIEAILHRCSDKVPTVRARALGNLGLVIELLSGKVRCRGHLQTLLGFVNPSASSATGSNECHVRTEFAVDNCDTPMLGDYTPLVDESAPSASPLTPGAGHGDLGSLLRRRCLDEKAGVRKSALFLLKKSVALSGKPPDEATMQAMGVACSDPLVSIRKAALSALTEVLRKFPADQMVSKEWLLSALPLAVDNETTLQDECFDVFEEIVLDKLAAVSAIKVASLKESLQRSREKRKSLGLGIQESHTDLERMLPPGILDLLKGMADGGAVASYVKRICTGLGKRKRVRPGVAIALQNIINASVTKSRKRKYEAAPQGTWMLLAEISAFVPKAVGWDFLRTHWRLLEKQERSRTPRGYGRHEARSTPYSSYEANTPGLGDGLTDKGDTFVSAAWAADRVHLLQTISNVAVELPEEAVYSLADELLSHLEAFNMHPAEVAGHVKALATLCRQKAHDHERGEELVATWVRTLMRKAGDMLQKYVSRSSCESQQDPEQLDGFHTPKIRSNGKTRARIPSQHKLSSLSNGSAKQPSTAEDTPISTAQIVTVVFTIGAIVVTCPSEQPGHIVTLLQTLVAPGKVTPVCSGREMDGNRSSFVKGVAPEISVQVWVTLAKLCLADNRLAKRCIPLFIQELERSDSPAVRNNIMIAMTDFCVRYTALVDGYIHTLTKSLQDPCELVRRQAFVLLARLLQRDYVKWRGMLFHRFLLALVDSSPKICQLASFLIGSILKVKAPILAYNSFVEAIFVLNDCHGHSGYSSALRSSDSERKLFSLRGNGDTVSAKRMRIYAALLQIMAPEHVLATSAKLCTEILGGAADGSLSIEDASVQCVLQDTFRILASKEMRIASKPNAIPNDTEDEGGQTAAAAVAAAKGRVVTQLMKKSLVQHVIPIFIHLKRILESKNSPLLGILMECLRVLLKEYKNEIEEILVADRQLQKELMYDMQKHEAAKARGKVAAAAAEIMTDAAPEHEQKEKKQGPLPDGGSGEVHCSSKERYLRTPSSPTKSCRGDAGEDAEKENLGPGRDKNVEVSTSSRLLRSSTVKRRAATTGLLTVEKGSAQPSPRVTWLDQTPGYVRPVYPEDSEGVSVKNPNHASTAKRAVLPSTPSPCIRAPGVPSGKKASYCAPPAAHLAEAVADVAAAATVTAVLKKVALKPSTPLKGMSTPRLRTPLSAVPRDSGASTPMARENRRSLDSGMAQSSRSKGKPPQPGSTRTTRSQKPV